MAFLERWKHDQDSKSKAKPSAAAAIPKSEPKKTGGGASSLFDNDDNDADDLFAAKKPAEPSRKEVKKPEEKGGLLFDGDGEEEDLFAAVAAPKDTGKKKPAGGVSLFGGADILGIKNNKDTDKEKSLEAPSPSEPPAAAPAAKASPQKKMLSLFDADDEEDGADLFGAPAAPKPPTEEKRKDRTKSARSLFEDEDILFGTPEDSPPVDIFSKTPPSAPTSQKPPGSPPAVVQKKENKPLAAAPVSNIFADDDDLFASTKTQASHSSVPVEGVTTTESTDGAPEQEAPPKPAATEPPKSRKPVGGVSMFGGMDPLALLKKKKPAVEEEEKPASEQEEKKETAAQPELRPKADSLFGSEEDGDLFGKPQSITVTKPVPIVAPKAQRPKVELPIPGTQTDSPTPTSPAEGPKAPRPPLSSPSDSKPFKKPVGGISMFGGPGALAELKKRTASQSQSDDLSPSAETASETQSPLSPLSPEDGEEPKPSPRSVSFSPRQPTAGKIDSLQKSLQFNPAALLPGAAPPSRDVEPSAIGFDTPADVNTLQSASKERAKVISRRRPQSRKARRSAALTASISFEDTSSPTSPDLPPVSSDPESAQPPKSTDLFGNDDLFAEGSAAKPSVPSAPSSSQPGEDLFSKGLFENRTASTKPSSQAKLPAAEDDDLFSTPSTKKKQAQLEDDIFGDPKSKSGGDVFSAGDSKPASGAKKPGEKSSRDEDEDDLFSSGPVSKKESSQVTNATKAAAPEEEDIFADSSLNKKKAEKKEKPVDNNDIFADSTVNSKPAGNKEEADIFSTASTPSTDKKRPKKAATKDETLFKDDTDIFSDLPTAKPKETKKKKKVVEKKGIFKDDVGV